MWKAEIAAIWQPRDAASGVSHSQPKFRQIDGTEIVMAPLESVVRKQVQEPAPLFRSAPHNIEAEQALLGAILVNNEAFYRVSDFLDPVHFFEPIHQKVYQVSRDLIRVGKLATPVTLKTFLDANTDIGGLTLGQYLARLAAEA